MRNEQNLCDLTGLYEEAHLIVRELDQAEDIGDAYAPRNHADHSEPTPPTKTTWAEAADLTSCLELARQGDETAFEVLYLDIQPRLLRYLRTLLGTDAEDVAAETWLHIATALPTFAGDSNRFRGWTATIARNRAIDHLRRRRRRPNTMQIDELTGLATHDDDPEHLTLKKAATEEALALIATLPRDQADAVLLRYIVGLDPQETANVLGKRAGAIRTATYRGLRNLARRLKTRTQHDPTRNPAPWGPP